MTEAQSPRPVAPGEFPQKAPFWEGRRGRGLIALGVFVAAVVPYLGILDSPFVFDDIKLVKENVFLRGGDDAPAGIFETLNIFSQEWRDDEIRPNYRPLRFLSYYIDYQISSAWFGTFDPADPPPFFFHLSNVLIHALNAVLLALCAGRCFARFGARRPELGAVVAGLLFALHPLQSEAVTYVSGRRDVLSTCFLLAAVALFLGPRGSRDREETLGPRVLVGVPLLFVGGLLTKEMVVTLPGILLLIDWVRGARWGPRRWLLHGAVFGLALGLCVLSLSGGDLVAKPAAEGTTAVGLTACRYVARYIGLLLFPASQSIDYSFSAIVPSRGWISPWTTVPAVLLVAGLLVVAGVALLRCIRRPLRPDANGAAAGDASAAALLALGLFWFLGTLLPVLQIVPIAERFAERFVYLPGIGLILIVTWGILWLERRERLLGFGGGILLCVVLAALTIGRNRDWRTPLSLWTAAVEAQPSCARAHLGRANALQKEGRLREAGDEFTRALEIFSEEPELPLHHGFILQALTLRGQVWGALASEEPEKLNLAIRDYRHLLTLADIDGTRIDGSSKHTFVHYNFAGLLANAGQVEEAKAQYRRVIEIASPAALVAAAQFYLGQFALKEGELSTAEGFYRDALDNTETDDPAYVRIHSELVRLLMSQKQYDEAWALLERGLATKVGGEARLHFLMRQAEITDRRGDLSGAIERLEHLVAEAPDYLPAQVTLAGIHTTLGNLDEAEPRYRAILARNPGHAEARQGLRDVALRRRALDGQKPGGEGENSPATLRRIAAKAQEHVDKGELLAAVKVFEELLRRADAAGETELEGEALSGLAALARRLGNHKAAAQHLEAALADRPDAPDLLLRMADLQLRHLQDEAFARMFYQRYIGAATGTEGFEPRALVYLANLTLDVEPAQALAYCQQARENGLDVPLLDRTLGKCYSALGRWKEALDAFNRFLDRVPVDRKADRDEVRKFVKDEVLPKLLEE